MSEAALVLSESVEQTVLKLVSEALAIDPERVQLGSNLMSDLGAESLDFLDLVFKIERAFDIQITRGEMERAARGDRTGRPPTPRSACRPGSVERRKPTSSGAASHRS